MGYLREVALTEEESQPLSEVKSNFGFIPNFYLAQSLRPDFIKAQVDLVEILLVKEGALERRLKEYVFLVCSAANLSTYCVTAHCEIVRMLGLKGPEPEQIALDHGSTDLPIREKALLNFALKLTREATRVTRSDVERLHTYRFSDEQILEAVAIISLAKFANFMSFGLGTHPDFDSSRIRLPEA